MRLFGLLGKTLTHSFSQQFFAQKFLRLNISNCSYQNFELPEIDRLPAFLTAQPSLQGFNVTIPYKQAVLPYLHHKAAVVQKTGACNCVKIVDGKLKGFNTDVTGFKLSLQHQLQPHHLRALVLGSGGAAQAVKYALTELRIPFTSVSRTKAAEQITYPDLNATILSEHQLIINATPLGMYPHVDAAPPIPYQFITPEHFLFDLVYNPAQTLFLKLGAQQNAQIANGYEMLVLQAEESWRIWNDETL